MANNRAADYKDKIITRQQQKIEALEGKVAELKSVIADNASLTNSLMRQKEEMDEIIKEINEQRETYKTLISDLFEIRDNMEEAVYGKHSKIVRRLMRNKRRDAG